jgi:hypothetical protein
MQRLTIPKLAVILATLVSFAWIVVLYALPGSPASGPRAVLILAIPVGLSLWGLSSERLRSVAGVALLVFSLVACFVSGWMIGLSYLPSSILLLVRQKGRSLRPDPVTPPKSVI